jgi:DNA primase
VPIQVKEQVKEALYNNTNLIINILEDLGCHSINKNLKEIRCALPDGDNPSSVAIYLNEYLGCNVYTRNKFEDFKFKDIITLICFLKKIDFEKAVEYACSKIGLQYSPNTIVTNINILNELRKYKRTIKPIEKYEHKFLNSKILEQYEIKKIADWEKENISFSTQQKYNIRYDKNKNRIVIPIYDEEGRLVSLKGRTCYENWEQLGLGKYWHYRELGRNDILFGLNFHKNIIKDMNEIILFEGEKSVMKAEEYGFFNSVALATNNINSYQFYKILNLKCNVVVALDKNVSLREVRKEAYKISKYTNVYIVYDKDNLLKEKDAPVDQGKEIWEKLYNSKIRVN